MSEFAGQIGAWTFWIVLAVCAYTYIGYPIVLSLLAALFGRQHRTAEIQPTVSLLIPAHNEAAVIREKIENSLSLDYPSNRLQILLISDGSDDGTDEIIREYESERLEFHRVGIRSGKPNAINAAVPQARGEVLLLCDANTILAPDAVRKLVRHFADEDVGAVTGDVRLRSDQVRYGQGEGLFYKLERFVQACESRLWTTIGVDGGMYAVRRALYVPNRRDALIDDFVIAMNVARAGARVVYDPEAVAFEDAVEDPAQEFRRRTRTSAGGFQSLFDGLGRPKWRQPGLWLGYLSHKVLRWFGPFLLIVLLVANVVAVLFGGGRHWPGLICKMFLVLQVLFYVTALFGVTVRRRKLPGFVCVPYYFCLANAAAFVGFFKWLFGLQSITWAQADRGRADKAMSVEAK